MMETKCDTLEVLISTFGREGIENVAEANHPEVENVRYLVAWQLPEGDMDVPESLAAREDFTVIKTATRGLSRNRNVALDNASGDILLISDDDVRYTPEGLKSVIDAFSEYPDQDILTFRYESSGYPKYYPEKPFPLSRPVKNYNLSSIELAFRRKSVSPHLRFNLNYGIGAYFIAGEENLFILKALRMGLKGMFVPLTICRHDGPSTSENKRFDPRYIRTQGAVVPQLYPFTWFPRMFILAKRGASKEHGISYLRYIRLWLEGWKKSRNLKE